jgi:hypothetical protein
LGVTGLSGSTASATAALLGSLIDGLTNADVDTVAEIQALADAAAAVVAAASGGSVTLAQLQALGIQGVTADNLATVQALLAASADDGTGVDSVSELQALASQAAALALLSSYTGSNTEPQASDYADAGITGVSSANLSAVNSALAGLGSQATDSVAKLQAVVDAYAAVLAAADGQAANTPSLPTAALYTSLGVTGLTGSNANAIAALLGSRIDGLNKADVSTVAELQTLANAAAAVVSAAGAGSVSQEQLQALGITGLTKSNWPAVQAALAATADDGSAVDTVGCAAIILPMMTASSPSEKASGYSERSVAALADPLPDNHRPAELPLTTAPRLIELCFQTAGLWEAGLENRLALPMGITKVLLLRLPTKAPGALHATARPLGDGEFAWPASRRQVGSDARALGRIEQREFLEEHADGPAVDGEMAVHEVQRMARRAEAQQGHGDHRAVAEGECVLTGLAREGSEGSFRIRLRREVAHGERRLTAGDLALLRCLGFEAKTEHRMARNERLDGGLEGVNVEHTVEPLRGTIQSLCEARVIRYVLLRFDKPCR